jgi:CheY-like chemotaxis protein
VNQVVANTAKLRGYQLGLDSVELETDLSPGLPAVLADPGRLQQVFLNLVNNSRDAITERGGGGIVRIETAPLDGQAGCVVRVLDNGPGIPEGLEERVFEPFFTTKAAGKGTGLGLSICRGILEDLGGRISAGRAPGGGACFTVELPAASVSGARPAAGTEPADVAFPRGRRVLVVDDERNVREVLARTLRLDEHVVETAANAPEALERLRESSFDAVFSDVRMPGMSGIDLYREIERRHRALVGRVIFFTGTAPREEDLDFFQRTGRPCLHKPFLVTEVRRTLAAALSPGPGARRDTRKTESDLNDAVLAARSAAGLECGAAAASASETAAAVKTPG